MTSMGAKYNMPAYQPYSTDHSAAANGAITGRDSHVGSVNAENPFVWLVGLAAVTLGLIGFSAHARVGSARAGVDVGST